MFKFRFPHKPNAKTKQARRVFFVRKRTLAIPAGLAAVCALCLITTLPSYVSAASTQRQLPIYCVQREDKVCSLTFDAAWGNEDTQQLIDILGRYHVKATFFVVGDWVEKYPESVKALSDAGHEVMSHSDTHAHFNALSAQEIGRPDHCGRKDRRRHLEDPHPLPPALWGVRRPRHRNGTRHGHRADPVGCGRIGSGWIKNNTPLVSCRSR